MDFGLREQDVAEIIRILQQFSVVEEAIIFGSRAKGNFKKGSDIDIAVKGKGIDHNVVASLSFLLNEETLTPYFFDIVHFEEISGKELIEHINRVGQCLYSRQSCAG
jgi:predicted nucleotidyltransferase